jgi:hypothetical protein
MSITNAHFFMAVIDQVRAMLDAALPAEDVKIWMARIEKHPENSLRYFLDLFREEPTLLRDATNVLKCRTSGDLSALPFLEKKTLERALA